jgi:thiamine pyrophosphate-dependent acetolactate synthase large subunit-like protein
MPSVRQAIIDRLRTHGLTTWFGNPGSSELTRPTLINIRTTGVGA